MIPRAVMKPGLFFHSIAARVFYGWWMLLLGCLIIAIGPGILYHGFTVFFLPLKRDLAVTSAAVSLLYGAARLEGGAEGPLVGYLIDRFGPRLMILIGAAMAGIGLLLLSLVHTFLSFFLVYVFIVSLGFNAGFFHPVYALVNSWFIRRRGIGFALTGVASSVGGMVMAPLLAYLILSYGWRTGAAVAGLLILVFALPCALPLRRTPESLGLLPDGRSPRDDSKADSRPPENAAADSPDFTVREALRTLNYWLLFSATTLRILVSVALTVHFIPILVWKGLGELESAFLVSLFTFGTIFLTLVGGWLGDRWPKPLLCCAGILATAVGMLVLMLSSSPASPYALPIGLSFTMGMVPLNWASIGDFFGRHSFATLRGIIGIGTGLGTFLSPIYAGWIFDRTGSYSPVLLTFTIIHLVASFLFVILYRRLPPQHR